MQADVVRFFHVMRIHELRTARKLFRSGENWEWRERRKGLQLRAPNAPMDDGDAMFPMPEAEARSFRCLESYEGDDEKQFIYIIIFLPCGHGVVACLRQDKSGFLACDGVACTQC